MVIYQLNSPRDDEMIHEMIQKSNDELSIDLT